MSMAEKLTVTFAGAEGHLALTYGRATELPSGARCVRVNVTLGPLAGDVHACPAPDVRRMRDDLAAALSSDDLSGSTHFGSVEHDLAVDVELHHGRGTIVATVRT
jgi:hypothetical protein